MQGEVRTPDVFVSYSSKNKNIADAIVSDFEKHGIRCWYAPRDIMPGESWVTAITDALQVVKVQVLVYTDESNASKQVMNEVAVAFNAGKTIVPFRLTQTKMSGEFEYYLARVHWLDAVTDPLSENISQLRKYVEVILSGIEKAYVPIGAENTAPEFSRGQNRKAGMVIAGVCAAVLLVALGLVAGFLFSLGRQGDREASIVATVGSDDRELYVEVSDKNGGDGETPGDTDKTSYSEDGTGNSTGITTSDGNTTESNTTDNTKDNIDNNTKDNNAAEQDSTGDDGKSSDKGDAADSSDPSNATDTSNTTDSSDTSGTADAAGTSNASDSAGSSDRSGNENLSDTSNSSGSSDSSGTSNQSDSSGTSDKNTSGGKSSSGEGKNDKPGDGTDKGQDQKKGVSDMTVEELESAAKKGDVSACDELGKMYYDGEGVEQDYGKALLYLTRADENGSTSTQTYKRLGDMYYYGKGVDNSDSDAGKYYKKAVDLGTQDASVLSNYGMVLYRDDCFEESAGYFVKASKLSADSMTMYNAALAYYGTEDYDNTLKWLTKAVDNGYERPQDAERLVKTMLDNGYISEKDAEDWTLAH